MSRRESRELAFVLLFEKTFTTEDVATIWDTAVQVRDVEEDAFALALAQGAERTMTELDARIARYSTNWNTGRLSRVALSVLRLAVYEMLFEETIPVSVSINEAVELAKKYGGEDDASFINGVLGGIARNDEQVKDAIFREKQKITQTASEQENAASMTAETEKELASEALTKASKEASKETQPLEGTTL